MSDAAGQLGSRLEVARVLTVGSRTVVPVRGLWAHRNTLYVCAQRGSQV